MFPLWKIAMFIVLVAVLAFIIYTFVKKPAKKEEPEQVLPPPVPIPKQVVKKQPEPVETFVAEVVPEVKEEVDELRTDNYASCNLECSGEMGKTDDEKRREYEEEDYKLKKKFKNKDCSRDVAEEMMRMRGELDD